MSVPEQADPVESDATESWQREPTPAPRRIKRVNESVMVRDVWHVLDRARTDGAPRTRAAAQDEVFLGRGHLPMARTLAAGAGGRRQSVGSGCRRAGRRNRFGAGRARLAAPGQHRVRVIRAHRHCGATGPVAARRAVLAR